MNDQYGPALRELLGETDRLRVATKQGSFGPHKYILLLTLVDLFEEERVHENRFVYGPELERKFSESWSKYLNGDKITPRSLEYPYFHLSSTSLWIVVPRSEKLDQFNKYRGSQSGLRFTANRIQETIAHAELRADVYNMFRNEKTRELIKQHIVGILRDRTASLATTSSDAIRSRFVHEASALAEAVGQIETGHLGLTLSNYEIYDRETNDYYECDLIVVSSFGCYVVEMKHWTGRIEVAPRTWVVNGTQRRPDPHANNRYKCKVLRGIYRHSFPTFPDMWFESVVVLTNPVAEVVNATSIDTVQHNPTFAGVDGLVQFLRARRREYSGTGLTEIQISTVVKKLESLRVKERTHGYNFPGYEIVDRLTQREDRVELVVRITEGRLRNLQRFRIFSIPVNIDATEQQRFMVRANNTLDAIAKTGEHPNILRVWRVPNENGLIVEGSDWSEEGTLAELIQREKQGIPFERAVNILTGLLHGLSAIHDKGIIHRTVKPENVLLCGQVPKLMNFDLAYQLEENHLTVIPDGEKLGRDPYIAPEVYGNRDIREATDLFSVGVIMFTLLTGRQPFKYSTDLAGSGGRLNDDQRSKLLEKAPAHIVQLVDSLVRTDPKDRPQDCDSILNLLTVGLSLRGTSAGTDRNLSHGEIYDLYSIDELIGRGRDSQVYRAFQGHRAEKVALKIFNHDVSQERAWTEMEAAQSIESPYVVRVEKPGHWQGERFFLVMNLVEGASMRRFIEEHTLPTQETFLEVALALIQALTKLHGRELNGAKSPLLHNDIKPDNILFKGEHHPVLIDFGAASGPRITTYSGTEGYVPPDLRDGADLDFCESGDLFALGVTLFEWLYGVRPHEHLYVGAPCRDVSAIRQDLPEALYSWLSKAVQTERAGRFGSVAEMQEVLRRAISESKGQPHVIPSPSVQKELIRDELVPRVTTGPQTALGNPFVSYLNTLYNVTTTNENALAESQAVNPFFGLIHVRSRVTEHIKSVLTDQKRRHIILTGHAGDGKSTIGLELVKSLKNIPFELPLSTPLPPMSEIQVGQRQRIVVIKDMSELSQDQRSEVLREASAPDGRRFCIISNTGTLLESFRSVTPDAGRWSILEDHILKAMSDDQPAKLEANGGIFEVINLVRMDNIETAIKIFQHIINAEPWRTCSEQSCRESCPIHRNVCWLKEKWAVISDRVSAVYRRLYEYEERLTLRQISGHLAYSITSGQNCQDISILARQPIPPPLTAFLFFNRFFGEGAGFIDERTVQMKAIRSVRWLETERQLVPSFERLLWMGREDTPLPHVPAGLLPVLTGLRKIGRLRSGVAELPPTQARTQVRRLFFFFGEFASQGAADEYVASFLNSRMLSAFMGWQKRRGELSGIERNSYLRNVLHVLQEHFAGLHLPEDVTNHEESVYITLNRRGRDIRQSAQVVLARLHRDDFQVDLARNSNPLGPERFSLVLKENRTQTMLPLDLPFLDYVMQRHTGDIGSTIGASYVDRLERFKMQILGRQSPSKEQDMMLVRLQTNHRFSTQRFNLRNNILEVF